MRSKFYCTSSILLLFLHYHGLLFLNSEAQSNTTGYACSINTTYPCQTYAFYRAMAPDFLDLASIADLFSVSRLMISKPSNISSPSSPLISNQPLFVPISCSCNSVNASTSLSSANITYTINKDDTFYLVSTKKFQNLTTYQSVEIFNPTLVPENLEIGVNVIFPIFCKCPSKTQLQNRLNYLISYVFQPSDNLSTVASTFGVQEKSITDANGNNIKPFDNLFIPVNRPPQLPQLPQLDQPIATPSAPSQKKDREGVVRGLSVGLGIIGFLLILVCGLWIYREGSMKKKMHLRENEEKQKIQLNKGIKETHGFKDVSLMADVSDCLDKYRVFGIDELLEATEGFSDNLLIQGSVYKGCIEGEVYAIKKMNWSAYEQLKILQKINHGNLVKLEGFCIDPENANCYLIYEYVENGSLNSWLHGNIGEKLNWKTRLRIAVDVSNGLQYIHEHTRPQVVHKDIKSSNILLDMNMRAKIANFGLAKSGCNAITMHIVGTQGYMAPEYLCDGVVSTKMDVFSFGVVLLELISGKEAIDEEGNLLWVRACLVLKGNEIEKAKNLKEWIDRDLFEESLSMESIMNVMTVAVACFHKDPSKRPSMVDIVYALCKSDDLFFDISDDNLSSSTQVTAR